MADQFEVYAGAMEMRKTEREERLRQTDHGEHYCGGLITYDPDHDSHGCSGMCGEVDLVMEECLTCEELE